MTTRAKAIGGISLVFLLGGLCGALVLGIVMRERVRDPQQLRDRDGFVEFFARKLELSETQVDSLRDELLQAHAALSDLRAMTTDRFNEVIDSLKKSVSPQLTPAQRELFADQEQKLRRFMPRDAIRRQRMGGAHEGASSSGAQVAGGTAPRRDSTAPSVALRKGTGTTDTLPSSPTTASRVQPRTDSVTAPAAQQVDPAKQLDAPEDIGNMLAGVEDAREGLAARPRGRKVIAEALKRAELTRDQLAQIVSVMRASNKEVRTLIETSADVPAPRLRVMVRQKKREGRRKALAVMTPEQQLRFFEYIKTQRREQAGKPE